jgi:putative ABC transport system permease protein
LETVGVPLLSGRNFGPADDYTKSVYVAIINEAMANRYFKDGSPVGKKFRMAFRNSAGGVTRLFGDAEIVGIAANSREAKLTEKAEPELYISFWQVPTRWKSLVVRSTGDPQSIVAGVERALRSVDPAVAIEDVKTLEQLRNDSIAPQLFTMRLLSGFSILACALALIGIYGVLSLSVAARRQEMAIRMAVGAQRRNVLGLILGEGLRLVGMGVVIGVGVAFAATRVLRTLLFGVESTDLFTLIVTVLLFMAVAALACYFPARRATKIDPMEALRSE